MEKCLLIIKTGSTFNALKATEGDFEQWFKNALPIDSQRILVVDATRHEAMPASDRIGGIVITGSPANVTENKPWMMELAAIIRNWVELRIPLIGICFGHQILAHAMSGQVDFHPQGKEIGSVAIKLTDDASKDPLFSQLPTQLTAHATHAQSVLRLPPGAVRLAYNDFEPNHAYRIGDCAWGVQFHPEFSTSAMEHYLKQHQALGHSVNSALNPRDTPEAAKLLSVFAQYCGLAIG